MKSTQEITEEVQALGQWIPALRQEVGHVVIGQKYLIDRLLLGLLANGHILLEGVPGLAKTLAVKSVAASIQTGFQRLQFTPDLLPADLIGTLIYNPRTGEFTTKLGPLFSNLILADEINRATPKTQSALLEAMQEHTVTSGTQTMELEPPFLVMATQNPIEMEGTYPLPEAQLDRFLMKILVRFPSRAELGTIVERTSQKDEIEVSPVVTREEILELRAACHQVLVAPHVQDHAINLVMATQPGAAEAHELANKFIRYGSSPRGAQALVECGRVFALMKGRMHLSIEDVDIIAPAILRHRIILNFDAHAEGQTPETILRKIIPSVAAAVPSRA